MRVETGKMVKKNNIRKQKKIVLITAGKHILEINLEPIKELMHAVQVNGW